VDSVAQRRGDEGGSRSWRVPYALAWLTVFGVYATVYSLSGAPLERALRAGVATLLPMVLLGILVLRHAARSPADRGAKDLRGHLVTMPLFIAASVAGWAGLYRLDATIQGTEFKLDFRIAIWQGLMAGFIYVALASVGHALAGARRAREESARAARAEALRARAELALLRTQVNPHFLLNTLHTMIGLVRREPALAETALERLGGLLHYGLRLHRSEIDEVRLADEWAFVEGYLELEKLRLGDRLRLTLEASPESLDCLVPPFALQPLVENAVNHAIAPRAGGGTLAVRTRRSGERLSLEVEDDGPGAGEAALFGTDRLGLRLLRERVAMLYNGSGKLSFTPSPGGGLTARLDLPAVTAAAAGA
jgi:LytS/YehU family sensor histidine kinase